MKTVEKHTLMTDSKLQTLSLKQGHRIVRIEYLVTEKCICLWVEVPLRADIPMTRKTYRVTRTNESILMEFKHVHTAVDLLKPEAFHIYEVMQEPKHKQPELDLWHSRTAENDLAA